MMEAVTNERPFGNNSTILFEDLLKYMGISGSMPSDGGDIREKFNDLFDDFYQWEESNFSSGSRFVLGDKNIDKSGYTGIRTPLLAFILISASVIGVCANIFVVVATIKNQRQIQVSYVILLVNLCLACLLFLLGGMPLLLVENVFGMGWDHGQMACQLHRFIVYGSFYLIAYSTVLLLLHICLSLWVPHRMVNYDKSINAIITCIGIWLLVLLCNIPNYLGHGVSDEVPGFNFCFHKEIHSDITKVRAWTSLQFIFTFVIPLILMIILTVLIMLRIFTSIATDYSQLQENRRDKKDVGLLAITISILFVVCWMPDKVTSLHLVYMGRYKRVDESFLIASDMMMCLAYSNPSLVPIAISVCMLRHLLPCKSCKKETNVVAYSSTPVNNTETNQQSNDIGQSEVALEKDFNLNMANA